MELDIGIFTEIIKYSDLGTINTLLMCCKQYNDYQNNIALLKELKHMKLIEKCNITFNKAAENGHVNVLEWFHNSDYEFKYSEWTINFAAYYGHINVLEWFHNSEYEFKYSELAILWAAKYGHINVLDWFHNSDYEFKYSDICKNKVVMKWFNDHKYKK
jgi:ankyrin repeat protein